MIKLIGLLLIFLFFGCSNQIKKDSQSSGFSENSDKYITVSCKLFETRYTFEFLSPKGENNGFLLFHSTGHLPHNSEIDVPIVYADYYFLESLIKKKNM